MEIIMKKSIIFLTLFLWVLTACEQESTQQPSDKFEKYLIAETQINDIKVEVYSDEEKLLTGYNTLFLKFRKDGQFIDVNINKITPMMNMGMKTHSTPFDNFKKDSNTFEFPVFFIMPSGVGTYWYLDLDLSFNGKNYKNEIKFDVSDNTNLQRFKYKEETYFVSMVSPRNPHKANTGMNNFTFAVHKKESDSSFPAVANLNSVVTPWMPDMSHGSPKNENPISIGNGYYSGRVNFIMTGYWTVKTEFFIELEKIGEVTHTFTF